MEEHWHTRIKDAFTHLNDFIESHKSAMAYDKPSVEYMTSVAMLKKADATDLKKAMHEVILGFSLYEGKRYANIELMKGFEPDKGGFIIYDTATGKNLSGPFMRSDFVFRFVSKRTNADGVVLPITCEIRVRSVLDNMVKRYAADPKMRKEFIDAWYYSTSCLADSFVHYMTHYCLKEVCQEDRTIIKNKIPMACFEIKPLGNTFKMENVFKLVKNISRNEYTKSALGTVGVDPKMIEHLIGAAQENIEKFDIDSFKNQALEAAQTGRDRWAWSNREELRDYHHSLHAISRRR